MPEEKQDLGPTARGAVRAGSDRRLPAQPRPHAGTAAAPVAAVPGRVHPDGVPRHGLEGAPACVCPRSVPWLSV